MHGRTTPVRVLPLALAALVVPFALLAAPAAAQGVELDKQNDRMVSAPNLGVADDQEKDYVWGDLNNNGWVDLVVMRKQPFTSPGKRVNVLFMNEAGTLVDRSAKYASAVDHDQITTSPGWPPHTDYPTDQGFLTPTNDRAAVIFDLDDDGWLDIVTATTISDGDPKHIGHPRVYMNLANDAGSNWQGLRFENARIPAMLSHAGNAGHNPRFCSVAAGDITGDGYADLYFGDYDSSGAGGSNQPPGADFNDKLLVNDGPANPGYFSDQTTTRFAGTISIPGQANQPFPVSAFGAAVVIDDINANGHNDIIKQTSLNNPLYVGIAYNLDGDGDFKSQSYYQVAIQGAPYFVRAGDLNNNGRLDIVITDDGTDRFRLNLSTGGDGRVNWSSTGLLPEQSGPGAPFGSNIVIADLNNNGWNDILIADVDVDISGCNRRANIYRNTGNFSNLNSAFDNVSSIIPLGERTGTFDFAVFDLTGNGWLDIVQGRCVGTNVWVQVPPFELGFAYPDDQPTILVADEPTMMTVQLLPQGGEVNEGSVFLHFSVNGGAWEPVPMAHLGDDLYAADLPAAECHDKVAWYFSGDMQSMTFTDPPNAPAGHFSAIATVGVVTAFEEDFDGGDGGFEVVNDPSLTQGEWQHGVPEGSMFFGHVAAPFGDASPDGDGMAWATCLGGDAATCNVAHGPTHLISPVFDLSEGPALIVYDRWMFCNNADNPARVDFLRTYVSNDGGETWVFVHETSGTDSDWETASFVVSNYVAPTANVKVRFSVKDESNNSITNAGIDNVRVEAFVCEVPSNCPADLTGNGSVGVPDLLELLSAWGPCGDPCPADLTGNGSVGVPDLLELLSAWGPCPQ